MQTSGPIQEQAPQGATPPSHGHWLQAIVVAAMSVAALSTALAVTLSGSLAP